MKEEVNWELLLHRMDEMATNQKSHTIHMESLENKFTSITSVVETIKDIKTWKSGMEEAISPSELKEFKVWKSRIDDVISPTQLKTIITEVEGLKTFKTQALMIWVGVQALMALLIFMKDFM